MSALSVAGDPHRPARKSSVDRRDFIRVCTLALAAVGIPFSAACISIIVTAQDDTPPRKASAFVKPSGCGRDEESSVSVASCARLRERPMMPLLCERTASTLMSCSISRFS